MLSGKKRNQRETNESLPPKKRTKVDKDDVLNSNEVWPTKQKLSNRQRNQLPSIMNPSFHKAVFQSFWNKKHFGSPSISFTETVSPINPKQKMYQSKLTLTNKHNQSQIITVKSAAFDSKKKSEIAVYQQFNFEYIPFKALVVAMEPYSFSFKANLQQIVTQKGDFLKSKTETISIEPLPLNCSESNLLQLIKDRNLVKYIEFERDSEKAIYQRAFVEFFDNETANKFVALLNHSTFQKHKLSVTWTRNRATAKQFMKKNKYLKVVGFPSNISKNNALQFLYQNGVDSTKFSLIFRYSLIPQVFLKFDSIRESVDAYEILNKISYQNKGQNKDKKVYKLYCRYSVQSEFDESMNYTKNIKKIQGLLRIFFVRVYNVILNECVCVFVLCR